MTPALSVRHALDDLSTRTPERVHRHSTPTTTDAVAADFAVRFGGVPATSHSRSEDVALYSGVDDSAHPVLLGLYGDERRVRDWLPGLPERANPVTARQLLGAARAPILVTDPPCAQTDATAGGLGALPVLCTTPRDAGPFLTAGLLCAHVPEPDGPHEIAASVHRMLVLDDRRLTLWMVPGRQLRAVYEATVSRSERLPITINIGAPPAAMIASALSSRFLPPGTAKLAMAGAWPVHRSPSPAPRASRRRRWPRARSSSRGTWTARPPTSAAAVCRPCPCPSSSATTVPRARRFR